MKIDITFPENVKKYIELQCNSSLFKYTNLPELKTIKDELSSVVPKNVLEIGAGIGRASVYLSKYFNWTETNFYLLDGDSGDEQVSGTNYESEDSFYNSIDAAREFCFANGMYNLHLLNAEEEAWKNTDVKFDLCYSFLAIGFHWPISLYLDTIHDMLTEDALLIFGVRPIGVKFDDFMYAQINNIDLTKYELVNLKRTPRGSRDSVIILRKI